MEPITTAKIFIVDDDIYSLHLYEKYLKNLGYEDITRFQNGTDCLNNLVQQPEIIFLDHSMDMLNGIDVLKKIKRFNPNIFVVFISGQEDIQTAVNSLKYGAFDYIVKNGNDTDRIATVLEKISAVRELLKKPSGGLLKRFFSFL